MTELVPTRGERNNNPGNLNYLPRNPWRGQLGLEILPPGDAAAPRFGRYDTARNGVRAIAAELLAYQRRDGIRTVQGLVARWAPSRDHNDTAAYAAAVSNHAALLPDAEIDLTAPANLANVTFAIIRQENGRCLYSTDLIASAVEDVLAS